jgi:hypothetical protein
MIQDLSDWDLFCGPDWQGTARTRERFAEAEPEDLARSARSALDRLGERLLPCDARCEQPHDPDTHLSIAPLHLVAVETHPLVDAQTTTDAEPVSAWRAERLGGALAEGTRLLRLAATDPYRIRHDTLPEETLFRITSGPFRDDLLLVSTYGPSGFAEAVAGVAVVPDHPPAHDAALVRRLLAYALEIQHRGERYQALADDPEVKTRRAAEFPAELERRLAEQRRRYRVSAWLRREMNEDRAT